MQDVSRDPANIARYADNPDVTKFLRTMVAPEWLDETEARPKEDAGDSDKDT